MRSWPCGLFVFYRLTPAPTIAPCSCSRTRSGRTTGYGTRRLRSSALHLTCDTRGHGASTAGRQYRIGGSPADAALADALGISRFILRSVLSGMIGQWLAAIRRIASRVSWRTRRKPDRNG